MGMFDSLQNLVANLAVGNAKTQHDQFTVKLLTENALSDMYRGDWLARKIINVPVADMFRQWRAWAATASQITALEEAEKRHKVKDKLGTAIRTARLYGGSAILIGADVARPDKPLDLSKIQKGGVQYLTVIPRWSLSVEGLSFDIASGYCEPTYYTLSTLGQGTIRIHPSRVIAFQGAERLDFDRNSEWWGDSALLATYDAIHHAALTTAGIAELVHEAKVDVISVPDLGAQLSTTAGTDIIARRFQNANALKSVNRMLLLDANEKWERKETSFTNLPDVLDRYLQIVSGASDIPATRLLGMSPGGLNSTGESDLRNYYDGLVGLRDDVYGEEISRLDAVLIADALGPSASDVYAEWHPLWQVSAKEKAEIASTRANTTKTYADLGILPPDVLAKGVANQLIEDGIYPGIEDELAAIQSAPDGFGDLEEEGADTPPDRPEPRR